MVFYFSTGRFPEAAKQTEKKKKNKIKTQLITKKTMTENPETKLGLLA